MHSDLQRVLDGYGVDAPTQLTPVVPPSRIDPAPTVVSPAVTGDQPPVDNDERRSRRGWILLALLIAVVIGLLTWWFLSGSNSNQAPAQVKVPDVRGMSVEVATRALTNADFRVNADARQVADATIDKGSVISTDPAAGSLQDKGSEVVLTVSTGPELVEIPPLQSLSYDEAASALTRLGLKPKKAVIDSDRPKDEVLNTSPPAGTAVPPGTTVTVKVSGGTVVVPNVVGKTIDEAVKILTDLGLEPQGAEQSSLLVPPKQVISQSVAAGQDVTTGTVILLTYAVFPGQGEPPTPTPTPTDGNGNGNGG
jgi:serine/threonine-protein kinase